MRTTAKERFYKKFKVDEETGCWNWVAASCEKGYGWFLLEKTMRAHRASYLLFKGDIPKGSCVCHTCDNPSCVNPDHLWIGTDKQNHEDKVAKNRQHRPKRKFSEEELEFIRMYPNHWGSLTELCRNFNCASSTMYYARTGKTCR